MFYIQNTLRIRTIRLNVQLPSWKTENKHFFVRHEESNLCEAQIVMVHSSNNEGQVIGYTRFYEEHFLHSSEIPNGTLNNNQWFYVWTFEKLTVLSEPRTAVLRDEHVFFDPKSGKFVNKGEQHSSLLHVQQPMTKSEFGSKKLYQFYKRLFLKKHSSLKFIVKIIEKKNKKVSKLLRYLSYIAECLKRNHSIQPYWTSKFNEHSSECFDELWSSIKKFTLQHGFEYVLEKGDNKRTIETWRASCCATTSATDSSFEQVIMNEFAEWDAPGHASFGAKTSPLCTLCQTKGYRCQSKGNPFLKCCECFGVFHLHCVYWKILDNIYYHPTLTLPNKRTFGRDYVYFDQPNGKYLVPGSKSFKCILCRAQTCKHQQNSDDWQYILKHRGYHYLEKNDVYVRYKSRHLNVYYAALAKWWNSEKIDVRHVCYDRWQIATFSISEYVNSQRSRMYLLKECCRQGIDGLQQILPEENFFPIRCEPIFWKSMGKLGSIITRNVLSESELSLIISCMVPYVTSECGYEENNNKKLLKWVVPRQHPNHFEQQWDITRRGRRCKNYNGVAHYTDPIYGNCKIKAPKSSQKSRPVLCQLQETKNAEFPLLLKLITTFIADRYASIQSDWIRPNQMQNNCYGAGAFIENHWDSSDWFEENGVLLLKTFKNSGLHLGYQSFRNKSVNPYLLHPLFQGDFCELRKWTFDWYQHCRSHWMCADNKGSITTIFRYVKETALFYKYKQQQIIWNIMLRQHIRNYYMTRLRPDYHKNLP